MTGCHESQFQSQSTHQQTVTITLIWDSTEQHIKDLMWWRLSSVLTWTLTRCCLNQNQVPLVPTDRNSQAWMTSVDSFIVWVWLVCFYYFNTEAGGPVIRRTVFDLELKPPWRRRRTKKVNLKVKQKPREQTTKGIFRRSLDLFIPLEFINPNPL